MYFCSWYESAQEVCMRLKSSKDWCSTWPSRRGAGSSHHGSCWASACCGCQRWRRTHRCRRVGWKTAACVIGRVNLWKEETEIRVRSTINAAVLHQNEIYNTGWSLFNPHLPPQPPTPTLCHQLWGFSCQRCSVNTYEHKLHEIKHKQRSLWCFEPGSTSVRCGWRLRPGDKHWKAALLLLMLPNHNVIIRTLWNWAFTHFIFKHLLIN